MKVEIKIGNKLRGLRINAKLTQREVALKLGIVPSAISHYEHDTREVDRETLCNFADIYKVPIETFYVKDEYHVSYIDTLIEQLLYEHRIQDEDNIPKEITNLILNTVKLEIKYKKFSKTGKSGGYCNCNCI